MSKPVKILPILTLVSGCALLLSACGGESSNKPNPPPPPPPPPAVISAHATLPSSVTAGLAFTANVSLTSSDNSGGTASVQVVDVGTVTPKIDCGQPQTLTIGGAGGNFTCQAPSFNPNGSNTHELQVNVNGVANLASPVPVSVVNGAEVVVRLTNTSGSVITTATPGQGIDVAFSTTTTPPGAGQYTVTAPGGWLVGNGGGCAVNAQSTSCKVPVTVAASAASGAYIIKVAAEQGSSPLSATSLPITVQTQPPPPPATSAMAFDLSQNISDTLYANLTKTTPPQTTEFTYQPVFVFENTSGGNLNVATVEQTGLTNVQYGCNLTVEKNANYTLSDTPVCNLPAKGLYFVSGDLGNSFPAPSSSAAAPVGQASISIGVLGSSKTFVHYETAVTFVKYVPGHVAVRVVNNGPAVEGTSVHAAAVYGPNSVKFSVGSNIGKTGSGTDINGKQINLRQTGGVFYMPYGSSGVIYLTRATGGFTTAAAPSPTNYPTAPPFLQIELTYLPHPVKPPTSGVCFKNPTLPCDDLTVDQTYVNFISMLGSFNVMGNAAPSALNTENKTNGTVTKLTQSEVYQKIEDFFNGQGSPWAYDSTRGQKNYIQKDANGDINEILAPIQVAQVTAFDPMPSTYYDNYVNSLWTYVEKNAIYVDASGANDPGFTPTGTCVLKGQVEQLPSTSTSSKDAKLVFSVASAAGTCAPKGESLLIGFKGNVCGPALNQDCADTPDLTFEKFNKCDFIQAAGALNCHSIGGSQGPTAVTPATFFENEGLWGPNGTYRALVGRAIAGYQAAGLLPCAGISPSSSPSKPMNSKNAHDYIVHDEGFSNPTCLTGLTPAPTWNVYAAALRPYVDVYTYSYGDFLGIDGTITFSAVPLSQTLYTDLPRAQPVTVILH